MSRRALTLLLVLSAVVLVGCSRSDAPPVKPAAESAALDPSAATPTEPPTSQPASPDREVAEARRGIAVLAGGCFWGMEELLRKQPGVIDTTVGYAGGKLETPTYGDVKSGTTGHAESVQVVFDPEKTSYENILLYFFKIHDPTTKNRQGNDVGTQYRSAIFVQDAEQRALAEKVKKRVDAAGVWDAPITTEIVEGADFYPAEDYHQDYLQRIPGGYTCHYERDFSI